MTTKEILTNLVNWLVSVLKGLKKPLNYICIGAIALIVAIILLGIVGCGSVTKIRVDSENPNQTEISVNQSKRDSGSTTIQVTPNVNVGVPYGSKDETKTE